MADPKADAVREAVEKAWQECTNAYGDGPHLGAVDYKVYGAAAARHAYAAGLAAGREEAAKGLLERYPADPWAREAAAAIRRGEG